MENTTEAAPAATFRRTVIHPWITGLLVLAIVVLASIQAFLIVQSSHFEQVRDDLRSSLDELSQNRREAVQIAGEIDSLQKQKDALAPVVAEWQKRRS